MAEKRGEAVEPGCIMLSCIFSCGGRGQGTQEVVCPRAGKRFARNNKKSEQKRAHERTH